MKPSDFATREEWIAAEMAQLEKEQEVSQLAQEKYRAEAEQNRQKCKHSFFIRFYTFDFNNVEQIKRKWFSTFTFGEPKRIRIYESPGKVTDRKYSKDLFDKALFNTEVSLLELYDKDDNGTRFNKNAHLIEISAGFYSQVWYDKKNVLLEALNDFFVQINGAFGVIANLYDTLYVHCSSYYTDELLRLNDSDYPGIKDLPKTYDSRRDVWRIDPALLPARSATIGDFSMFPAPYMWFGPTITSLFPSGTFENFADCVENKEFVPGFRRIVLGENLEAYNDPSLRKNQWAFKKKTDFEKIMSTPEADRLVCGIKDGSEDASIEFKTGTFPHGGELLAIYYLNEKGRHCSKSDAVWKDTREMKGNDIVWQERTKFK